MKRWLRRARRAMRRWRMPRLPPIAWALVAVVALAAANFAYHAVRKPSEIVGLLVPSAAKTPEATWAEYGRFFDAHSTDLVPPELLAALAQVESGADPLARTYWRWRWRWNPVEIYAPASSAVGMLQMTDGTFAEARRLCIHDHEVARAGAWHDPRACWFNALYFRTVPSHAIEMTAARLHEAVTAALAEARISGATRTQKQRLAAYIHLCGPRRGVAFALRGFWAVPGERCGDHDVAGYLGRVDRLAKAFARMSSPP